MPYVLTHLLVQASTLPTATALPEWWSVWALPIGAGICLAAATGFRTFVPLLGVALASRFGLFALDGQYAWLVSTAAVLALATAAVLEVGAYYIPVVDNALDLIATPLSMVAGTLVMFTSIGSDHGLPGWLLATIVGGGLSGMVQLSTVKARALSTGTTAGLANPVLATGELIGSVLLSGLALFLPVIAAVFAVVVIFVLWRTIRWLRRPKAEALQPVG